MKELIISQFILGMSLSWGPCLASCGTILLPYIAGTKNRWYQGLKSTLIFSLGRVLSYVLLFGLTGLSSKLLSRFVANNHLLHYFKSASGIIILIFGMSLVLPTEKIGFLNNWCKLLHQKKEYPLFILGVIVGFSPCVPLIGNLLYLVLKFNNLFEGILLGLAFGIGTLISPLFFLGAGGGAISQWSLNNQRFNWWLRKVSGIILIMFSLEYILFN